MQTFVFGETVEKLPIMGYRFGTAGPSVLILGGVHGDETEGVIASQALLGRFTQSFTYKLNLTLIPILNVDGVLKGQRKNAAEVDLNRNLPTNDWTAEVAKEKYAPGIAANDQPENQALVNWLTENKPRLVISLHSWNPLLNVNGQCLPEAEAIANINGYTIENSIGYPTPGCLGTYCGLERDMPTLTYEIERGMNSELIIKNHVRAILEALKVTEDRF